MPVCLWRSNPTLGNNFGSEEALSALQNCTSFRQLRQIHGKIIRAGLFSPQTDPRQVLLRRLIQLCSSYDRLDYAALVFRQTPEPLAFTWNLMMRAYTSNGFSHRALLLFNLMLSRGFPPDKFTFPFLIKACAGSFAFCQGQLLHALAIKTSFSNDIFVQNTLMDFYFKCGHTHCGHRVFDKMRVHNVVSWTTMVRGLVNSSDLRTARLIFEQMPTKNVVSWTVMIDGHIQNQQHEEAFELFTRMQLANVRPNEFTLVSLLKACTDLGSLELGRWIHDFALKNGFELEVFLGTALIDMYSKCGSLEDARRVFDKMQSKSLATWNSMITSLGVHGFGEEALALFAEMEKLNVQPDAITFVGVLCACLQTNNLNNASNYLEYMNKHYGISPIAEHYACMIEMYSRAGMLSEVGRLVKTMPAKPSQNIVLARPFDSNTHTPDLGTLVKFSFWQGGDLNRLGAGKMPQV